MQGRILGALCLLLPMAGAAHAQGAATVQAFSLTDASAVVEHNVKAEPAEYLGRKALRITVGEGEDGLAMLRGTDFQDGVIESDIALKITAPPWARMPGFVGIAFRSREDGSQFEMFYLRPKNSHSEDQAMRNHSVQYVSEPDFPWERLRRSWPEVYESHAELKPEKWVHVKIEVAGRLAKLYLDGAESPSLIVDGLKGPSLRGAVGLWGYAREEAYFSNVRITPAAPQPVKNGSESAGEWNVRLNTDGGGFEGHLKLVRDGGKLTGSWSGTFGDGVPVTGSWRDGYVELSFPGIWSTEMYGDGQGPLTTTLAGWIDGDQGKGRARVTGHADGQWSAERGTAERKP